MKKISHNDFAIQELSRTIREASALQDHFRRDLLGRKIPDEEEAKRMEDVARAIADTVFEKLEQLEGLVPILEAEWME